MFVILKKFSLHVVNLNEIRIERHVTRIRDINDKIRCEPHVMQELYAMYMHRN